jgi:conjugal transfer pilus assembly protein TraE
MHIGQLATEIAYRTGITRAAQAAIGFLLLANVCLAFALASADRTHRETMIPPDIHKTFWVEDETVAPEYLEQMGLFLIKLALDNTPSNVDYNAKTLLKYAAPASFGELQKTLLANGRRLAADNASTMFSVRSVTPNAPEKSVAFAGVLTTYIGDKRVSEAPKTYLVRLGYAEGRCYILELRETSARTPFQDEPVQGD